MREPGPAGSARRKRLPTALLLAAILVATVVPRLPLLANAAHFFNSDEAANALVLGHMLDGGGFTFYNWEMTYYGVQESLLAIPFVGLLGREPLAFKLAAVVGSLFLVVATFVLGTTLYGRAAGLAAAALLITFSPHVVQWTTLAIAGFGLVMGWGSLMFAFLARLQRRPSWLGVAWLGFMAGFGFYMYELFIDYLAVLALAAITASFPWQALLARGAAERRRALSTAGGQLRLATAFAAGFAIGWAPKIAVLLTGASGERHPDYEFADLETLRANAVLLVRECIPAFLGVNPTASPKLEQFTGQATTWVAALGVVVLFAWVAAWAWGLARVRATLAGAVARPPTKPRRREPGGPAGAGVRAPLRAQHQPARHPLEPLPLSVAERVADSRRGARRPPRPVAHRARRGSDGAARRLPRGRDRALAVVYGYLTPDLSLRRPVEPLVEVLEYLREKEIGGAYGGYWTAFKATFLSRESIVVAPYRDWDRYPPYTKHVDGLAAEAYIFFDPVDAERHAAFLADVQARGAPFETKRFDLYLVYTSARPGRLLPP